MKQLVNRLDVAMFNALLRESADEMPTDPVSDPISDSKVLPIPAGKASFGAGAQLKNAVSIKDLILWMLASLLLLIMVLYQWKKAFINKKGGNYKPLDSWQRNAECNWIRIKSVAFEFYKFSLKKQIK